MTQQVDKLQQLLTRVQGNRNARASAPEPARAQPAAAQTAPAMQPAAAAAPVKSVAAAPAPVPARPVMQERERGSVTEERVSLPAHRVAQAQTSKVAQEIAVPARKPERDRLSTPLEMALEDELTRAPSEPPTSQFSPSAARPAASPAGKPVASPSSFEQPSFSVEPEPLREPNRSIAQVVSKHAPEVDATFGAMLKRSLGLRPR